MDINKVEIAKQLINKIDNKENNIYFYCVDTKNTPLTSVIYIYDLVKHLTEAGYKAHILHQKEYTGVGDWLGKEYTSLSHVAIDGKKEFMVDGSDIVVLPEGMANMLKKNTNLPCKTVVLCQSYSYILELLPFGDYWSTYGVSDAITTSQVQADYIKSLFPSIETQIVPVNIKENFKPQREPKKPIVAISSRNQFNTLQIAKSFILKYPLLRWVTFSELRGLKPEDYTKQIQEACLLVWDDENAGFGTAPLEALKCGVPVIAKVPNLIPEWALNKEGELIEDVIWVNSTLDFPMVINKMLIDFIEKSEDIVDPQKYENKYGVEEQKKSIISAIENISNKMKKYFNELIKENDNE